MADDLTTRRGRRLAGKYPIPFFVRATEEEARRIVENARRANRNCSRFLAELGAQDGSAERMPPRPTEAEIEVLEMLMFQLRKVGINLNQVVHREHACTDPGAEHSSDAELIEAARAVRMVVQRIQERLT